MPKAPKLILSIEKEKAQYLPPHIVISSVMVNPEMEQDELRRICESLVDTLFYCIVNHSAPGLYLPPNSSSLFRNTSSNITSSRKEENKSSSTSSLSCSSSANDNDDNDEEDDKDNNKQVEDGEKTESLMKQSGGKDAIIKAMLDSLDQDFFPFLIQAWEVCEESSVQHQQQNHDIDADDESKKKKQIRVVKNPNVGCMLSKRGELLTMGSLEGCGLGVAGVFCNGE